MHARAAYPRRRPHTCGATPRGAAHCPEERAAPLRVLAEAGRVAKGAIARHVHALADLIRHGEDTHGGSVLGDLSVAVCTRGGRRMDGESSLAVLSMPKRAPDGDDSQNFTQAAEKSRQTTRPGRLDKVVTHGVNLGELLEARRPIAVAARAEEIVGLCFARLLRARRRRHLLVAPHLRA